MKYCLSIPVNLCKYYVKISMNMYTISERYYCKKKKKNDTKKFYIYNNFDII